MEKDIKESRELTLQLFIATPAIIKLIDKHREHLKQYRDSIVNFETPKLSKIGLDNLTELINKLLPGESLIQTLPQSTITQLKGHYEGSPENEIFEGADNTVQFQVYLIIVGRLCRDYLDALELYEKYSNVFNRYYSHIFSRSEFTGEINWEISRQRMIEVLRSNFMERYDNVQPEFKIKNEALSIAFFILSQSPNATYDVKTKEKGLLFEEECACCLKDSGFDVEMTRKTGDFGVDLIARKNGLSYAVQCKALGMPAGISSVQEVIAGRLHYATDYALVVSTQGFTASARQLAQTASVMLLSCDKLYDLEHLTRYLG